MNTRVSCNKARKLIDEADHAEALSFEASSHVASCADCGSFAEDRLRLRRLLASGSRVSVPMNFDAVLKARLSGAKSRSSFAWLNPAGYLRLGAATAGLVVMVFAAQYGGLFRNELTGGPQHAAIEDAGNQPGPQTLASRPPVIRDNVAPVVATTGRNSLHHYSSHRVREISRTRAGVPLTLPGEDYLHQDGGVMLVRGSNGEGDVSLPMVSVGAQSLVYASAGASRPTARTVGTSF